MAKRYIDPRPQYFDDAGDPLVSGKVYIYEQGSATTKDLFFDAEETLPAPNPVILSASGRLGSTFFSGTARAKLTDSDEVQFWDIDNIASSEIEGAFAAWTSAATYDSPDLVTGSDGEFYQSLTNGNTGNDPISDEVNWKHLDLIGYWNTNITYAIGDIVIGSGGNFYKALVSQAGNNPTSDAVNWGPTVKLDALSPYSETYKTDTDFIVSANEGNYQVKVAGGNGTITYANFLGGSDSTTVDIDNTGGHTVDVDASYVSLGGSFPVIGTEVHRVVFDYDGTTIRVTDLGVYS